MDQEPVEVDLDSEIQAQVDRAAEVQVVWVQDWADRVAEVQVVWVQDWADRVAEVQVVWVQDRAAEARVVWVQDWADQVAEDQAAVHKRSARGLELATTGARLLFPVWSPVLRGEPLVGAANRQKKSFSGFSERSPVSGMSARGKVAWPRRGPFRSRWRSYRVARKTL